MVFVPLLVAGEYKVVTGHVPNTASAATHPLDVPQAGFPIVNLPIEQNSEEMRLYDARFKLGNVPYQENASPFELQSQKQAAALTPRKTIASVFTAPARVEAAPARLKTVSETSIPETAPEPVAEPVSTGATDVHRAHLPEVLWVDAYVKANAGEGLDNRQLVRLAHEEYVAHQAAYPNGLTLSDAFATPRARRTVSFIEGHLQRPQLRAVDESPLN
jgi:hypothetical protein